MNEEQLSPPAAEMAQIAEAQTTIRWLYDVRDRVFRYYLIFLFAALGAIGWGSKVLASWEYNFILVTMVAVSLLLLWQILMQRLAIDREKSFIASTNAGRAPIPPLYRESTKQEVLRSSTMLYVWFMIVVVSALSGILTVRVLRLLHDDFGIATIFLVGSFAAGVAFVMLRNSVLHAIPETRSSH